MVALVGRVPEQLRLGIREAAEAVRPTPVLARKVGRQGWIVPKTPAVGSWGQRS
ncbi:hypothetical protein AB0L00_45680 [Actinoallomurus sp. NPDC052308]|uniref:hypothetical protein n=1 Tax=Actinoallomurus sp. NPDC052308 TaxID=3155530 RepID=UPI0034171767